MAVKRFHGALGLGAAAALALPGLYLLQRFDPNAAGNPFPPCLFHALTGLYCPGCGGTRAAHALVHGDLVTALSMNPLLIALIPTVPALVAWSNGWRPAWLQPVMKVVAEPRFWLALLPAFTIARNLPWPPFSWLAPG